MNEPTEQPVIPTEAEIAAEHAIRLEHTDHPFARHWKSGSLKYADFQPLTEGGSATLQTCKDMNLQRTVVYKSLHPHLQDSEIETGRFLREARVTAMIPHPGTVPVYELGRDRSGVMYFTMKKLEGRDLRSILMGLSAQNPKDTKKYPLSRLIDILIQACQTIAFAHAEGVIHRDLKPANILVGGFGEVMVIDWGLAKVHGEESIEVDEKTTGLKGASLALTQPGRRYGTPLYMSPEQARADADIDERTDVFNLGSILFEMLTGKNLVWGNTVEEVLEIVRDKDLPRPRDVAPRANIPADLEAVCIKALAKNPEERYASVKAFAQDLQRYRDDLPVEAYTYPLGARIARWPRRNAYVLSIAAAAAAGAMMCWLIMRTKGG